MNEDQNQQTILLAEILKWIKIGSLPQVKSLLASILDSEQKRRVYQLSDGQRNIAEIMKITGVGSKNTVINYWRLWKKQNIGRGIPVAGGGERFKRDFDLDEIGLLNELEKTQEMTTKESEGIEAKEGKT